MIISQNVPQVDTTNMHISAYFNDFLAKSHLMNNLEVSTFVSILFLLGVCQGCAGRSFFQRGGVGRGEDKNPLIPSLFPFEIAPPLFLSPILHNYFFLLLSRGRGGLTIKSTIPTPSEPLLSASTTCLPPVPLLNHFRYVSTAM